MRSDCPLLVETWLLQMNFSIGQEIRNMSGGRFPHQASTAHRPLKKTNKQTNKKTTAHN